MIAKETAYYLYKKIEELEEHYKNGNTGKELFHCEMVLLFFADYNVYSKSFLKDRINKLFIKYRNNDINISVESFVHKYAALIALQYLLRNDIPSFEFYMNHLLNFLSHHSSNHRFSFSVIISFLLNKDLDFNFDINELTLKEHLCFHCEENIKQRHGGNIYTYALISFLNISKEEKIDVYENLYHKAINQNHSWDINDLENLKTGRDVIENPFYDVFCELNQVILIELSQINVPTEYNYWLDKQLGIFDNNNKTNIIDCFNFDDRRLQKYLVI